MANALWLLIWVPKWFFEGAGAIAYVLLVLAIAGIALSFWQKRYRAFSERQQELLDNVHEPVATPHA